MGLKRDVGVFGILFASVSAIIGSGWLFGPLYAAQMAGPAALLAWIIGGAAVMLIAFCYAELACRFPVAGGLALFPLFSHGILVSEIIGWLAWLAFILITPIEVQAVIQYSANYIPSLISMKGSEAHLSSTGYLCAFSLLLLLTFLNSISVKFMSSISFFLTLWKLFVPILVIIFFFNKSNMHFFSYFSSQTDFMPYGLHGVFASLSVGGVVFAFNGFHPGIALAGETSNPKRNIPISIIGSLLICTIIYCLLQAAFLIAIPDGIVQNHDWKNLTFSQAAGPLAGLAVILGLIWLAKILYIDALISPMGAALVFFAAAARTSYAMSKNNFLPGFFKYTSKRGIPIWGVVFNLGVSVMIFLVFHGWQEMASFYAAAICCCNSFIPLALCPVRNYDRDPTKFQIPYHNLLSFSAFYLSNLMFYWCGWNIIFKIDLIIAGVFLFSQATAILSSKKPFALELSSANLLLFVTFLSILSKLGSYGGGTGLIGTNTECLWVFLASCLIFWVSQKLCISKDKYLEYRKIYLQRESIVGEKLVIKSDMIKNL